MTPIVISDIPIILLNTQQPATQHLVVNVKTFNEIQIQKHAQTGLKYNRQKRKYHISLRNINICRQFQLPLRCHHLRNVYHQIESHVSGSEQRKALLSAGKKNGFKLVWRKKEEL